MAAAGWWCWPLPAWLGSGAAWFVLLNVVVGAIFALSSRAQPQSPSPRRGITRRASSVLLQRLRSFSVFSSPSPSFHTEAAPEDSHATSSRTEDAGPSARAWSPSTPRAPIASAPAGKEEDEEDVDSLSMDDVYALVQARRQQPPPTEEEEAAGSEVDAKAEEFIRGFKDDLRQQRLDSIFNYTQMLKQRAAGRGTPEAEPDTIR
ncbi:pathogen-associated molecular patterns-induced protein A70-like [Lolium rigidum]|uniref:pathogen-associated molecular patterns-induced protein A70-like n=1 Tax=Lolium rigidum TaxID=89674 RepID=UPI001F5D7E47|nr:pathogen-associated molecular patterns-induced protein A70-like [Lolium rigidum]